MKKKTIIPILFCLVMTACNQVTDVEYSVMKGRFVNSFTETGNLASVKAVALVTPRIHYQYGYEFKIIQMAENGEQIHKGDTVIRLDDSSIQKHIIKVKEQLENERAAAKKKEVECTNAIQDLEAQLKTEQAKFDLTKLEMERAEFEPEQKQKIKELQFKQAILRLNNLKHKIQIKPTLNAYDLQIQNIRILQKKSDLTGAISALDQMNIVSPEDGMFQSINSMFGSRRNLAIGDAVYPEMPLARIPDITKMCVNTFVSETDFSKIELGTKVIVRMDALPSVPFSGEVSYINKICTKRDKEKIFIVQVIIDEIDLRLKPGMTVSSEFICYEGDNELFVPNNCLYVEKEQAYVFVDKGKSPKKIKVDAISSNSHHTLISGKLQPGQKLIPFENILNP